MPGCKDTYVLLVHSQWGMNWTQAQKTRSTGHSHQWPSGQAIPFHGAASKADCQVKPSPALHRICALLQLRHQLGKQLWVSKPQLPSHLWGFFLLYLLTEISAAKPMVPAQHQPLRQRQFPQILWIQALTQGPALENRWGIPFHRVGKETRWKHMFTEES